MITTRWNWAELGVLGLALACPFGCAADGDGDQNLFGAGGYRATSSGSAGLGSKVDSGGAIVELKLQSKRAVLLGSPPPASPCPPLNSTVLAWSTGQLTTTKCKRSLEEPQGLWHTEVSERTLSTAELARVESAVANIRYSNARTCGFDAGVTLVDRVTTEGIDLWVDDFYSGCPSEIHQGREFISGVVDLWEAIREPISP